MELSSFYGTVTSIFEVIGVLVIIVGMLLAVLFSVTSLVRGQGGRTALQVLRNVFGGGILLGLEIFVAADLVRTITEEPTLNNALSLLVIVVVRTLLSWTIQIEMDGVLPWKRALFESGALVAARGVKTATQPTES